jgi:hypothetical protein
MRSLLSTQLGHCVHRHRFATESRPLVRTNCWPPSTDWLAAARQVVTLPADRTQGSAVTSRLVRRGTYGGGRERLTSHAGRNSCHTRTANKITTTTFCGPSRTGQPITNVASCRLCDTSSALIAYFSSVDGNSAPDDWPSSQALHHS